MKTFTVLFSLMTITFSVGSISFADPGSEKFELVCTNRIEEFREEIRTAYSSDKLTISEQDTADLIIKTSALRSKISISVTDKTTGSQITGDGQNRANLSLNLKGASALESVSVDCHLE